MTAFITNLPMCSSSLIPFSSNRSCSSSSSSGTALRLVSINLSSIFPAVDILLCLSDVTRAENWAASRERTSASLKRALREKPAEARSVSDDTEASDVRDARRLGGLVGGLDGGGTSSYTAGVHRARVLRKVLRSAIMVRRSIHAAVRNSSHDSRIPRSSRFSDRSRSKWSNLSNS